jgi:hypothetical protein
MIVFDTSAFISLSLGDALGVVLDAYAAHTTQYVQKELRDTAANDSTRSPPRAIGWAHRSIVAPENCSSEELERDARPTEAPVF